jgi:hypothetical protein
MLKSGLNNCWSTPIYKTSISKNDCDKLIESVMLYENIDNPQSDFNDTSLTDSIPLLEKLAYEKYKEFFLTAFNMDIDDFNFKFKSWLTGSRGNYYMDLHNHSGSPWVAVFYILSEEADKGGEFVAYDPRANANRGFNKEFKFMFEPIEFLPKTGDVIIMPGFVYHAVRVYQSTLRLAIPVDLFIQE